MLHDIPLPPIKQLDEHAKKKQDEEEGWRAGDSSAYSQKLDQQVNVLMDSVMHAGENWDSLGQAGVSRVAFPLAEMAEMSINRKANPVAKLKMKISIACFK